MSPGSVPVVLGRSLTLLSLSFPLLPVGLMTPLSGWDKGGGDEGFLFGIARRKSIGVGGRNLALLPALPCLTG